MEHAAPLLERYRDSHCVFNDDVQVGAGGGWWEEAFVRGV